jgi:hypothetical protein
MLTVSERGERRMISSSAASSPRALFPPPPPCPLARFGTVAGYRSRGILVIRVAPPSASSVLRALLSPLSPLIFRLTPRFIITSA